MLPWKYLVIACSLALTVGSANATTFDWSITGDVYNGNGTLVASGSGGTLTVTAISGTILTNGIEAIFGPYNITGPLAPGSTYAGITHVPGDNLLFYPTPPLVDSSGIIFSVEQAPISGLEQFMDIFFSGGQYFLLRSNSTASGVTFSVSPEISSTPLPAALPLFASGLGALGLLGRRRKKKAAALAA